MTIILRNTICIIGLILSTPLIIFCVLLIFIDDGFPVMFKQIRVGLHKEDFIIFKLRTMKNYAPSLGTHEVNNSFYLSSGSIIRKLKLDELPQLLNVLKGELNLIGFRPCLKNQYELIEAREKRNVFNYKPGITGLAQVTGYDMSDPEALSRIDKIYYNNRTFKLDMQILICTLSGLFRQKLKHLVVDSKNV